MLSHPLFALFEVFVTAVIVLICRTPQQVDTVPALEIRGQCFSGVWHGEMGKELEAPCFSEGLATDLAGSLVRASTVHRQGKTWLRA